MFGFARRAGLPNENDPATRQDIHYIYNRIDEIANMLNSKMDCKIQIKGGHMIDVRSLLLSIAAESDLVLGLEDSDNQSIHSTF